MLGISNVIIIAVILMFSKYSFIQIFPKHHIPLSTKLWFCLYKMQCNATVSTSQSILQLHQVKEGQVKCINTTRFRDGKLNWLSMKMKTSIQSPEVSAFLSHFNNGFHNVAVYITEMLSS